ncbi:MAG: IS4 family transposase [Chroococcidiopsidaceae cyanobacterium CP_BM_RX_35]|nr:IS4 family transposase [Chroococcidiopsidaceae cyanobacterium CP_BM_RX_35]
MLHSLYQNHLENQLEPSELLLFNILINLVQDLKEVSLEKLATALPLPILFESRRKKIQRFLSLPSLRIKTLWFPIIKDWLAENFPDNQPIYLVIDRTSWERQNLIMISVIYDSRAIPVYFELLPKLGSSNFAEQKRVFSQVLPLFKKSQIIVLGDREFCSVQLANWLRAAAVKFCLRLKKNENIETENGSWQSLDNLGLAPGISWFYHNIKVTKTKQIEGFNVAGKWQKKFSGSAPHEGWFILTNLRDLPTAIKAYRKRFDIEEMFRDFKSGGYNLEDTNVSGYRLTSLILIVAFVYSSATFKGQEIKKKGVQKYIGRVREYGRLTRRHSSFYIGLYGQDWVRFMDICWGLVEELMQLNRNKLEYYLRGMRAMELITATF